MGNEAEPKNQFKLFAHTCRSCREFKEDINKRSKLCRDCALKAVAENALQIHVREGIAYDNWQRGMQAFYERLVFKKPRK